MRCRLIRFRCWKVGFRFSFYFLGYDMNELFLPQDFILDSVLCFESSILLCVDSV